MVRTRLDITTTKACYGELTDHTTLYPGERYDADAKARKEAAERVLDAIHSEDSSFNWTYCGEVTDLGEHSIPPVVEQHDDRVDAILMMESGDDERQAGGRAYVRRLLDFVGVEDADFAGVVGYSALLLAT